MVSYPDLRLRRVREHEPLRRMVRETTLSPSNFIYPMFVTHGQGLRLPIEPMPGCFHFSIDQLVLDVAEAAALGIPGVLLFGLPAEKDPMGTEGYDPEGIIQEAVRAIKKEVPGMMVITDVCMCEYTDHGHCGIIDNGKVDNDATLELLARTAVTQVQAGADMVAPSAMMDGQVKAIRDSLNDHGYKDVPVMGYAAKYASAFYGPFRVAAGSTPQFGDRRSYQMDPANAREAMREIESDIGRDSPGPREVRPSPSRLQRQRRVLHGQGRRSPRLDRRKADHPRDPDLHKKSRRRLYPQLPRQRGVSVAEGRGVSALSL